MGDIYLDMLVGVCVSSIVFQCKGFPLVGERGLCDANNEGMAAFVRMCWYGVSDNGWEGVGVMMRRDMGDGEGGCMVSGKGGCVVNGCMVGGKGGCGEGVRGKVVLAFFLSWLTFRDLGVLLLFALLVGICFYPSFKSRVLLSQRLHLINVALLEVSELLLHFGLPFQDGSQVQLIYHNLLKPCFRLL